MQPTSDPARLPRGHRAAWSTQRTPRRERFCGRPGSARGRFSERLRGLPRWVHAVPYAALVLLSAVLLSRGRRCAARGRFAAPRSSRGPRCSWHSR